MLRPGAQCRQTHESSRARRAEDGSGSGGHWPALSEDGNRPAFWSTASDLVGGDTNGLWDIFVHDLAAGSLRRAAMKRSQ